MVRAKIKAGKEMEGDRRCPLASGCQKSCVGEDPLGYAAEAVVSISQWLITTKVSEELCSTSLHVGTQLGRACATWSVASCHDGGERV